MMDKRNIDIFLLDDFTQIETQECLFFCKYFFYSRISIIKCCEDLPHF